MYETGSGVGSVGRDPGHWEVRPFTRAQEAAAQLLDMMTPQAHQPLQPPLRSCVVVGYLGASFCAACALGKPHGSKQCGSVLHHHRDNGAGANSQQSTPNHTPFLWVRLATLTCSCGCHTAVVASVAQALVVVVDTRTARSARVRGMVLGETSPWSTAPTSTLTRATRCTCREPWETARSPWGATSME